MKHINQFEQFINEQYTDNSYYSTEDQQSGNVLNIPISLNETVLTDFVNALYDLDPAALTAAGISTLPIIAMIKSAIDVLKKDPNSDKKLLQRLQDAGKKVQQNR